tara:strand:+ start:1767 stop:2006 length:240 start_codon:yes stop_codon:yes gene_type:complete
MTEDIKVLLEAWEKLKSYVPAKDRLDAAISYVNLIDDYGADEQDWREIFSSSNHLHDAYNEVFGEMEEDDPYSEEDEDY